MPWAPSERPAWLARLIAHGPAVGGASRLISLDPAELIATAITSTGGLDDFGDSYSKDWRAWFDLLTHSINTLHQARHSVHPQLHADGSEQRSRH